MTKISVEPLLRCTNVPVLMSIFADKNIPLYGTPFLCSDYLELKLLSGKGKFLLLHIIFPSFHQLQVTGMSSNTLAF